MRFSGKTTARLMAALLAIMMLVSTLGTVVFADTSIPMEGDSSIVNGTKYQINPSHMTVTSTIEGTVNNVIDSNIETVLTATGTKAMIVIDLGAKYTLSEVEIIYGDTLVAENYSGSNAWYCNELYVSNYIPNAFTTGDTASAVTDMKDASTDAKYVGNCDPSDKTTGNGVKSLTTNLGEYQYVILYNASRPLDIAEVKMYSSTVKVSGATVGVSSGTNLKNAPVEGDESIVNGTLFEIDKANIKVSMPNSALGQKAAAGEAFPYNVIDSDTTTTLTGSSTNDMVIVDLGKKYDVDYVEVTYGSSSPNGQNYKNYSLWLSNELPNSTVMNSTPADANDTVYTSALTALETKVNVDGVDTYPNARRAGVIGKDETTASTDPSAWKTITDDGQTVTAKLTSWPSGDEYQYVIIQNQYRALDIAEITVYSTAVIAEEEKPIEGSGYSSGVNSLNVPVQGDTSIKVGDTFEIDKKNMDVIMLNSALGKAVAAGTVNKWNIIDSNADTALTGSVPNDMVLIDLGKAYDISQIDITFGTSKPEGKDYNNYMVFVSNFIPVNISDSTATNSIAEFPSESTKYEANAGKVAILNGGTDGGTTKSSVISVDNTYRYVVITNQYRALDIADVTVYSVNNGAEKGYSSGTNLAGVPVEGDETIIAGSKYEVDKAHMDVIMPNTDLGQKLVSGGVNKYNVIDSDATTTITGAKTNDMVIIDLGEKYHIDSVDITYGTNSPNGGNYANYNLWFANVLPNETVMNTNPGNNAADPVFTDALTALQNDNIKDEEGNPISWPNARRAILVGKDDNLNSAYAVKSEDGNTVTGKIGWNDKYRYVIILNQYRALDIADVTVYSIGEIEITHEINADKTAVSGKVTGLSTEEANNCQLIAASYDTNGVATKISTQKLSESKEYTLATDPTAVGIELFIWKNDGTIAPVISPVTVIGSEE